MVVGVVSFAKKGGRSSREMRSERDLCGALMTYGARPGLEELGRECEPLVGGGYEWHNWLPSSSAHRMDGQREYTAVARLRSGPQDNSEK